MVFKDIEAIETCRVSQWNYENNFYTLLYDIFKYGYNDKLSYQNNLELVNDVIKWWIILCCMKPCIFL